VKVDLLEFRDAYLAECEEHLGAVQQRLASAGEASRAGRPCGRELRDAMRLVHTIKGLSAMVGVEPIVTIAHHMESLLRSAERAGGVLSSDQLEVLLDAVGAIEQRVGAVARRQSVGEAPAALLARLEATVAPDAARPVATAAILDPEIDARLSASEREQLVAGVVAGRRALRVDFVPSQRRSDSGITITSVRGRVGAVAEIVKIVPVSASGGNGSVAFALVVLTDATDDALKEAAAADAVRELVETITSEPDADAPEELAGTTMLRVEVQRVDDALEKLAALVVSRSRVARAVATLAEAGLPTRDVETMLAEHGRQLRDLRDAILRVRMVPIATVLERLPLLVRSVARTTHKDVEVALAAGDAELDKAVAERVFPALIHLVRNAVDHGIEPSDERVRVGKSPFGKVSITCFDDAGRGVEIRVRDDGRGIDRAAVGRRAHAGVATDEALLDVLCRPGFSTRAEAATTTSGRGVGMDVVKRIVVDGLGGEIALETAVGRGTTVVLKVPLTITIVDAFTVQCGLFRFAVPVPVVDEVLEVDPQEVVAVPRGDGPARAMLVRRERSIPLFALDDVLGLHAETSPSRRRHALVVRRAKRERVAFAVDRVLGQQETVVRPLADPLVMRAGLSGSTDLGDGIATLVLDLPALSSALSEITAA